MACEYEVEFKATKTLENVEKDVKEVVEELKSKLLHPDDFNYTLKVSDDSINLKVKSLEKTATQFLLQLDKILKEKLGKKYKVGIKDFSLKNYIIEFEVTQEPMKPVKIPFADLKIEGKKATLLYKKLDETFVRRNGVERSIKLVEEKIAKQFYEGKGEYHEILYESPKREPLWKEDPTEEMLKRGWLVRGPTKGKWFLRPQIVSILKAMEEIVMDELVKPMGFQEVIGSNIISGDEIWKKTGHLEGMPMEIYYVAEPVTRNPEEWESFIDKLKITKEIPYDEFMKLIQIKPLQGLTYAQCPIIYWSFKNRVIPNEDLPLKIFDRTQNSFRYESGGRHGLERMDEFHRIEIVYIGTPEQMIKIRDEIIERYKHIFNNILEIEWRTAWVTPFYMQQSGEEFKQDYGQKVKGTIDFEAWLPYRGSREESEWLEFQNISIVGEKYTNAFNIKPQKGELWSGCTGIGLERWAVAFLAQKGLDPEKWPKNFRKYLKELPRGFRFF